MLEEFSQFNYGQLYCDTEKLESTRILVFHELDYNNGRSLLLFIEWCELQSGNNNHKMYFPSSGIIIMGYVLMLIYAAFTQARIEGRWLAIQVRIQGHLCTVIG